MMRIFQSFISSSYTENIPQNKNADVFPPNFTQHHVKSESFPHDDAQSPRHQNPDRVDTNENMHHVNGSMTDRTWPNVKAEQHTTTSRQYGESDQNPTTSVKTKDDLKTSKMPSRNYKA